jgi:hypothetical protein
MSGTVSAEVFYYHYRYLQSVPSSQTGQHQYCGQEHHPSANDDALTDVLVQIQQESGLTS